jgi:hypothetical protein
MMVSLVMLADLSSDDLHEMDSDKRAGKQPVGRQDDVVDEAEYAR